MNGNLFGVVLLFLAMAIVSKLMALPQIHKLNKQLMEIKRSGPVSSVGMARHWRGNRACVSYRSAGEYCVRVSDKRQFGVFRIPGRPGTQRNQLSGDYRESVTKEEAYKAGTGKTDGS